MQWKDRKNRYQEVMLKELDIDNAGRTGVNDSDIHDYRSHSLLRQLIILDVIYRSERQFAHIPQGH